MERGAQISTPRALTPLRISPVSSDHSTKRPGNTEARAKKTFPPPFEPSLGADSRPSGDFLRAYTERSCAGKHSGELFKECPRRLIMEAFSVSMVHAEVFHATVAFSHVNLPNTSQEDGNHTGEDCGEQIFRGKHWLICS